MKNALQVIIKTIQALVNKLPLPGLKVALSSLFNLIEVIVSEIEDLKVETQKQKDEINRLKGEQGKPNINPGITWNDNCESATFTSYGFSSENLGAKNPNDTKLLAKSSKKKGLKKKKMQHSSSSTIIKSKKGAESKAKYQAFMTVKAHATTMWAGGHSSIVDSLITFDVKKVRYVYDVSN